MQAMAQKTRAPNSLSLWPSDCLRTIAPIRVIVAGRLRSMPPVLITNAWPVATRIRMPTSGVRVDIVLWVKKLLVTKNCENSRSSTTTPVITQAGVKRNSCRVRSTLASRPPAFGSLTVASLHRSGSRLPWPPRQSPQLADAHGGVGDRGTTASIGPPI